MKTPAAMKVMLITMMIGLAACSSDVMGPEAVEPGNAPIPEAQIENQDELPAVEAPEKRSPPVAQASDCEGQSLSQTCLKGLED